MRSWTAIALPLDATRRTIGRSKHVFVDPTDLLAARSEMRPYIEAGATHLVLHVSAPYPVGIVQRLAEEVVEPLRTEYASR